MQSIVDTVQRLITNGFTLIPRDLLERAINFSIFTGIIYTPFLAEIVTKSCDQELRPVTEFPPQSRGEKREQVAESFSLGERQWREPHQESYFAGRNFAGFGIMQQASVQVLQRSFAYHPFAL